MTHDSDLIRPVPSQVQGNQLGHKGRQLILEIDGIFSNYFHQEDYRRSKRFYDMLIAEINWIEQFTKHAPSIGTHYEKILLNLIKEYLPSTIRVGTGFVYDSIRERCSPQIDIICYSDAGISPIYRRDDFVIVQPESVKIVCEVKKHPGRKEIADWINKTISNNLGTSPIDPAGMQRVALFAYSCPVKTETIEEVLKKCIADYVDHFHTLTNGGRKVILEMQNLCLPEIILMDREEYISVSVLPDRENLPMAQIWITVFKNGGIKGVSPLLGLLSNLNDVSNRAHRDHCSSFLREIIRETKVGMAILPMQSISAERLVEIFPESRDAISKNKVIAASLPSYTDVNDFKSISNLQSTPGFYWKTFDNGISTQKRSI